MLLSGRKVHGERQREKERRVSNGGSGELVSMGRENLLDAELKALSFATSRTATNDLSDICRWYERLDDFNVRLFTLQGDTGEAGKSMG